MCGILFLQPIHSHLACQGQFQIFPRPPRRRRYATPSRECRCRSPGTARDTPGQTTAWNGHHVAVKKGVKRITTWIKHTEYTQSHGVENLFHYLIIGIHECCS